MVKNLPTGLCTFSLSLSLTLVVLSLSLGVLLGVAAVLRLRVLLLELEAVQPVHVEDLPAVPPVAWLVGDRVILQLGVQAQQVVQQKVTFILVLERKNTDEIHAISVEREMIMHCCCKIVTW